MKLTSTVITGRSNSSLCGGKAQHLQGQRRQGRLGVQPCSPFSSTLTGLWTMNLSPKVRLSLPSFTAVYKLLDLTVTGNEVRGFLTIQDIFLLWGRNSYCMSPCSIVSTVHVNVYETTVHWGSNKSWHCDMKVTRHSLCNFFLFLKLKLKMKVFHFEAMDVIDHKSDMVFEILQERIFQGAFDKLNKHWDYRYVAAHGAVLRVMLAKLSKMSI